jgi:uncharacterized membrane protein
MSIDLSTLLTILGMAVATYATRVAGWLLLSGQSFGPRLTAAFEALPPAVLTAVIAPGILTGAPGAPFGFLTPELVAAAITILAAWRLPFLLVIVIGAASVVALRWAVG